MRLAALILATSFVAAPALSAQDADRSVGDGGIKVAGWEGRVDRRPAAQGKTVADSKLASEAGALRLSVGPAGIFWNPANTASGNYMIEATFKEHKMASSHPHSYGIFIGGNDLKSDTETLMYCIVYGDGTYAIKTFHGAKVTELVPRSPHEALIKAADGEATNKVTWMVMGDKATCSINGKEAKSFAKADVIGADKLTSLDGNYGLRVSHNLELTVSGLSIMKH